MEAAVSTPLISSAVCLTRRDVSCHGGNSGKWSLKCGKRKYYMGTFYDIFYIINNQN